MLSNFAPFFIHNFHCQLGWNTFLFFYSYVPNTSAWSCKSSLNWKTFTMFNYALHSVKKTWNMAHETWQQGMAKNFQKDQKPKTFKKTWRKDLKHMMLACLLTEKKFTMFNYVLHSVKKTWNMTTRNGQGFSERPETWNIQNNLAQRPETWNYII